MCTKQFAVSSGILQIFRHFCIVIFLCYMVSSNERMRSAWLCVNSVHLSEWECGVSLFPIFLIEYSVGVGNIRPSKFLENLAKILRDWRENHKWQLLSYEHLFGCRNFRTTIYNKVTIISLLLVQTCVTQPLDDRGFHPKKLKQSNIFSPLYLY